MRHSETLDTAELFTPAILKLGEIHWHLLRAAVLMQERSINRDPTEGGRLLARARQTPLGEEIGRSEIHWWVFKREPDVAALQARTETALASAQRLKEAARELKDARRGAWSEIVALLTSFAAVHSDAIEDLLAYVRELADKDVLAPSVLFNYTVWGSTRISDRWPDLDFGQPLAENRETAQLMAEYVLGLRDRFFHQVDRAAFEIGYEDYESDPETERSIDVSPEDAVRRASYRIFDEGAVYFEFLRNGFRGVAAEIEDYLSQSALIHDDAFWRRLIERLATGDCLEGPLHDFKETLPMWRAGTPRAREQGKIDFVENVAAFANANGGVLIVGVTDRPPRQIVGIGPARDVETMLAVASDVLARRLVYPRAGDLVTLKLVSMPTAGDQSATCLIVLVRQAADVVGVDTGNGAYTYPVRRATGLQRESQDAIFDAKVYLKRDNRDFLSELIQMTAR